MGFDWGQGAKGAGGGALAGASMGAALGPWGAAAGGVIGGGIGLLSGFGDKETENEKAQRQMLMDYYAKLQNRPMQPGMTAAQGMTSDVRGRQLGLLDQLKGMSEGKGPSLAEAQLRSATDRNVAQQAGMANSGRGGPMSVLAAQNNMAHLGARSAQDAAAARIQEQQQALQLYGLNLHGTRGADEEMSRFNAGQSNDVNAQNMWARLKQMGMQDDAALQIMSQLGGQNAGQASRPGLGDQVLAGGAGMYSQYATQSAASKAAAANKVT